MTRLTTFSVQFTGVRILSTSPGGATRSRHSKFASGTWPSLRLINRPTNQDGCKNATIHLAVHWDALMRRLLTALGRFGLPDSPRLRSRRQQTAAPVACSKTSVGPGRSRAYDVQDRRSWRPQPPRPRRTLPFAALRGPPAARVASRRRRGSAPVIALAAALGAIAYFTTSGTGKVRRVSGRSRRPASSLGPSGCDSL